MTHDNNQIATGDYMTQIYEGMTLTKKTFHLDECVFINCVLKECHIIYDGGDVEIPGTRFENAFFHFRGQALKTIQALQMIGMLKVGPLPIPMKADMGKAN
jgi:hypothetical protein